VKGYEFTSRGKITIAALLVLIVLVIPSVIVSIVALASSDEQGDPPSIAEITPHPTETPSEDPTDRPPQNDGGLGAVMQPSDEDADSDDIENEDDVEDAPEEYDETEQPPDLTDDSDSSDGSDESVQDPPEEGLVGLNVAAGTMAFIFFPDMQTTLDLQTASRLGDFLSSPQNVENARIIIEIPHMHETARANIINALTTALESYGVARHDIVFFTTTETAEGESFEVRLSFHRETNRK